MNRMRFVSVVATALAAAACSQTSGEKPAAGGAQAAAAHEGAPAATAPLADAIATALARSPGEALEAGLETETEGGKSVSFVEVMVIDAHGEAIEVKVDPADGSVLSASKSDEEDETPELVALQKRLPAGHLSLGDLARRAAVGAEGRMIGAAFAAKKDADAVAVVRFLVGKELRQVTLDPKTGAVLAKRTLAQKEEDEDDEKDEKDEKGK